MAALSTSSVAIHDSWFTNGLGGVKHVARRVTLTLSSHGNTTTANSIPAAALSMREFVEGGDFVKSDNSAVITLTPTVDGSLLVLTDYTGNITTASGAYTGVVVGQPVQ